MSKNNIEKMKALIEEKKQASSEQGYTGKIEKSKISACSKGFKPRKKGGLFDK